MEQIDEYRSSVTLGEDHALIDVYLTKTAKSCLGAWGQKWRKPVENEVLTSAALFYRNFFSKKSVFDYDPSIVLLACLNLSCKTEESHSILLRDLCSGDLLDLVVQQAVSIELELLAILDFNIQIEQPWPVILLASSMLSEFGQKDIAQKVFDSACEILSTWQWSDVILVFPLPLLALAALYDSFLTHGVSNTFDDIVSKILGSSEYQNLNDLSMEVSKIVNRHSRLNTQAIEEFQERCKSVREGESLSKRRR